MKKVKCIKLATKISLTMIMVLLVIFAVMTTLTLSGVKKSLQKAIGGEFLGIANENALLFENVMDKSSATYKNISSYLEREYANRANVTSSNVANSEEEIADVAASAEETATENPQKAMKSVIYDVPLTEQEWDMEQYLLNNIWSTVSENEFIAGVGVYFEPYGFDSDLETYSMYTMNTHFQNRTAEQDSYSEYSKKEYYIKTKETLKPYYTKPYKDSTGIDMVSATYPIVCNGEFKGIVLVDIDMRVFETFHSTDEKYPSMYVNLTSESGISIYDTKYPEEMGLYLQDLVPPEVYQIVSKGFSAGQSFFAETVGGGGDTTRYFIPVHVGDETWWAQSALLSKDLNRDLTQISAMMLVVIVVSLVVTVSIMVTMLRKFLKPVELIVDAANQIKNGDLDIEIESKSNDEIGKLSDTFNSMAKNIREIISDINNLLGDMSEGDFVLKIGSEEQYTGDYSTILKSIKTISSRLSDTLTRINHSSNQVASSSDQVSAAAQQLSQGSTEQASAVEELSATIMEISEQIKETAQNTKEANTLVGQTEQAVILSSKQMKEMVAAMEEISNTSGEIGKIIKAINDIAFQTNILALNAAVEAARAGAAGKGFAVVADEVRNLAGKSAEAAKSTTELIESAITSINKGTAIADETAKSLTIVVDNASEVGKIVEKIAQASDIQANSVVQVTQGMEQISSVVQTNSATAQQCAAASEELNGQAQVLKQDISKFKLAEVKNMRREPVNQVEEFGDFPEAYLSSREKEYSSKY